MPVTHVDVVRLARGAPPQSFVEWLAPDEVDMAGEPESFVELAVGRRLLVLAHKGSAGPQAADCTFWREDEGCSVYPQRPTACRTYPFEPEAHGDGEQRRVHLRVHPDVVCDESTGIFAFSGDAADEALAEDDTTRDVLSSHETRQRELSDYVARVSAWNRRQRRRRLAGRQPESAAVFLQRLLE